MSLQTILGLIAHLKFDRKRTAPPVFPDKVHWHLGRFMYALGIITVLLGLYALPARKLAKNSYYLFGIVILFLFLALEKHIGQTHELYVKGIAEDDEAFIEDNQADDVMYTPQKGNSLSRGLVVREFTPLLLCKLLFPAGLTVS
jgi:hypothetical protein